MSTNNKFSSLWQPGLFRDKVVFCTGGSGDVCSVQVQALVQLGADACIIGRDQEKATRVAAHIAAARTGSRVLGLGNVDVRNYTSLEAAVSRCVTELGKIDFVIAGAAGNFLAPFLQLSNNAFRAVLDIDLIGSWNTAKATVPQLLKSASQNEWASGRIIFISATGHMTGQQLNTHASVAKAGVEALAGQLAIELGPRGVTSNVISPGGIAGTEGVKRLIDESGSDVKKIPLGRLGTVEDVANAAVFLFSSAGNYVNGATLIVDGGAWRTNGGQIGGAFEYPDFLLSNEPVGNRKRTDAGKL